MKKTFRTIAILMALAMLTLMMAACEQVGGEEPAKAQTDAEYIEAKGTLVCGITMYPPMNYYDADGKLIGYDTEVAEAICAKLGLKAEFIEINWDSKEIELNAKNIDCIWNGMTITDERKENMSITAPYINNSQALVMKADREAEIMANVEGLTITAEAGSTGEGKVDGTLPDDGTETTSAYEYFSKSTYVPSDSMAKALMEVKSGTADLAIVDSTLALFNVGPGTDYEDLVCNLDLNFGAQQLGVAFRKGSDFTAKVDAAMAELLADGTLDEIAAKYGLQEALVR